mmetsp:Transcript_37789/g.95801  ORF Transcript_37789/g.95801 Transcript_37789/m.95801 type:complete len:166 (-) Transcript_37789:410-907(-)
MSVGSTPKLARTGGGVPKQHRERKASYLISSLDFVHPCHLLAGLVLTTTRQQRASSRGSHGHRPWTVSLSSWLQQRIREDGNQCVSVFDSQGLHSALDGPASSTDSVSSFLPTSTSPALRQGTRARRTVSKKYKRKKASYFSGTLDFAQLFRASAEFTLDKHKVD